MRIIHEWSILFGEIQKPKSNQNLTDESLRPSHVNIRILRPKVDENVYTTANLLTY